MDVSNEVEADGDRLLVVLLYAVRLCERLEDLGESDNEENAEGSSNGFDAGDNSNADDSDDEEWMLLLGSE
jgi:hypothetical protein